MASIINNGPSCITSSSVSSSLKKNQVNVYLLGFRGEKPIKYSYSDLDTIDTLRKDILGSGDTENHYFVVHYGICKCWATRDLDDDRSTLLIRCLKGANSIGMGFFPTRSFMKKEL